MEKSLESWDGPGVWPTSPPLPSAPGSGPPSSPPESSSLRAAPGAEQVPPPAPTVTGSPKTWPARAAAPRRAAPAGTCGTAGQGAGLQGARGSPGAGPRQPLPRRSQAARAPPPAGLPQAPPLSCRQSPRELMRPGTTGLWRGLFCRASGRLSVAAAPGHCPQEPASGDPGPSPVSSAPLSPGKLRRYPGPAPARSRSGGWRGLEGSGTHSRGRWLWSPKQPGP